MVNQMYGKHFGMKAFAFAIIIATAAACGDNMSLPDSPDAILTDGDPLDPSVVNRLQQCPATKAHGTITKICAITPPFPDASGSLGDGVFNLTGTRDYRMIISPDVGDVITAARAYVKGPVGVTVQLGITVDPVGTIPLSGSIISSNVGSDVALSGAVQTVGGSHDPVTVVAAQVYVLSVLRVLGPTGACHVYQIEYDYRRPLP